MLRKVAQRVASSTYIAKARVLSTKVDSFLSGSSSVYVEQMYDAWRTDPKRYVVVIGKTSRVHMMWEFGASVARPLLFHQLTETLTGFPLLPFPSHTHAAFTLLGQTISLIWTLVLTPLRHFKVLLLWLVLLGCPPLHLLLLHLRIQL